MLKRVIPLFLAAFAVFAAPAVHQSAAADEVFTSGTLSPSAIRGYDTVAYFTQGKPAKGSSDFTHKWKGATWRFASAANRDMFAANPEKYAPQYGGYCAWAVAQGYTASTVPEAWKIVDGKLYLNYSKGVQQRWESDVPGHIVKGDGNWPGILDKLKKG